MSGPWVVSTNHRAPVWEAEQGGLSIGPTLAGELAQPTPLSSTGSPVLAGNSTVSATIRWTRQCVPSGLATPGSVLENDGLDPYRIDDSPPKVSVVVHVARPLARADEHFVDETVDLHQTRRAGLVVDDQWLVGDRDREEAGLPCQLQPMSTEPKGGVSHSATSVDSTRQVIGLRLCRHSQGLDHGLQDFW